MEKQKTIDWRREGRQLVRDYLLVVIGALMLRSDFWANNVVDEVA